MKRAQGIELIGGHPALDFANTAGNHESEDRSEWLRDFGEVTGWARHAGLLDEELERALDVRAAARPDEAHEAWRGIVSYREAVYRTFAAVAQGRTPAETDLATLHRMRVAALEAARPVWEDAASLRWDRGERDFLRPVHPVAVSVFELLGSPELARLKQCGNHPCGWLFLDRSRNGSRRWCSSGDCGNLTRVRRYRARRRGQGS